MTTRPLLSGWSTLYRGWGGGGGGGVRGPKSCINAEVPTSTVTEPSWQPPPPPPPLDQAQGCEPGRMFAPHGHTPTGDSRPGTVEKGGRVLAPDPSHGALGQADNHRMSRHIEPRATKTAVAGAGVGATCGEANLNPLCPPPPSRDALEGAGGAPPPPPSRAPSLRPATVPLTASAGLNGICNRH